MKLVKKELDINKVILINNVIFIKGKEKCNVDGVFVTIGTNPNSETFRDLVSLNALNEIIVDHSTMETSIPRNLCNW